MSKQRNTLRTTALLTLLCLGSAMSAMAAQTPVAEVSVDSSTIVWQPFGQHPLVLTVSGPGGDFRQEFDSKSAPYFEIYDNAGQILADGNYTWELTETPAVSAETRAAMARARETGDYSAVERLLPAPGQKQSGSFTIADGAFVSPDVDEKALPNPDKAAGGYSIENTDRGAGGVTLPNPDKDQVIPDDLIVQGSLCVGFDCVNNEPFGFDTIRLKENNLRILFQDTSVGAFPTRDWQLTANDSASGGASRFSIEDVDGSLVPFTIEAGAPSNSAFVDDGGRLGLGTATPVLKLHLRSADTPAIRLEQDGSGGFTPQTWDIAGNEANFFVRDVTSGSRLSFRIQPGAPTSSLVISSDGDVGVGTLSPDSSLHVIGSDGSTSIHVEENSTTAGNTVLLHLDSAAGAPITRYTSTFGIWDFTGGNSFTINDPADAAIELQLQRDGTLTVFDLIETSDVNAKENFSPVDPIQVLNSVATLPISTWNFKQQDPSIRQFGPMAQDFYAAFGIGHSDTTISSRNLASVALAAIQGLNQKLADVQQENAQLLERLAALEAKLQAGN